MRQIKFRARPSLEFDSDKNNKDIPFVYGTYYNRDRWLNEISKDPTITTIHVISAYNNEGKLIGTAISPDTLSQFTGLLDKNGVEIYEGDIVAEDEQVASDNKEPSKEEYISIRKIENFEYATSSPTAKMYGTRYYGRKAHKVTYKLESAGYEPFSDSNANC